VKGTISRIVPFGAFVQLEEGIEGIIPNSELSYRRVNKPESVVKVGEEVEVKVIDISPEERRMTLSKRQAEPIPEPERPKEREHGRQSRRDPDRITIGDVLDEDDRAALTSRSRRGTKAKAEAEAEAAADAEERELMYEQDEE
jgi:small subunit ribosomal protein S1